MRKKLSLPSFEKVIPKLRHLVFLVAFIFATSLKAQTYPVQAFVQISPPFTSYLPDYSDPFNNQMKVLLTLTDFSIPSYQVKLRFTFEGNGYTISTASLLSLPVTTLTPGVPIEISGSDLAPYFNSANLIFSGIDVADYELRKVLPEGPCSICVEVIDFSNPNQSVLANTACSQVWFSLNDPPLLNTPFCGNVITPTDPQQLIFSWTPLHMNSPNSLGTQYVFELFEIRPNDADPNQVVNSTLPIFMQVTDQTYINYGIVEPQLQTGMEYVWRVKAQDIAGRDIFRNNGYSTVCTFTYGNIAASLADGIVLELNSNGTGVRQGLAWWNASSTFTHYKLEVRKTGNDAYEWFPYTATVGDTKINSLEPSTQYECRVKGLINEEYESEWSNISVFTTQPAPDYACASTTLPAKQQVISPLTNAIAGMYFTVGQFEMLVTDIEPINEISAPGHYKGTGKINVGFALINLRVKFDDILVDENLMVRSGKVEAITQGIEAWENSLIEPDYFVDGTIDNFVWNDSTSLTVWVDGVPQTFEFDEDGTIIIQDEEGSIYTFNADGTYTVISILVYSSDKLAATKDFRIDFSADPNQKYGFDKKQYAAWIDKYEVIKLDDATNYFVSYKSIAPGENDFVIANVTSAQTLSNLTFSNESGSAFTSEKLNDTTYRFSISNLSESDFIYAWSTGQKIGKLWVKVLPLIEKEIVIVPVNGSNLTNISAIEENLNKIYAQANVKFNVTLAENYQNADWDLNADGKLQNGDSELMTNYSEEMRGLRDNYFETHPDYNNEAYHLFVVSTFSDDDLAGYMVRGKGVGFLKNAEDANTAAHELAHGIFALEHTFPEVAEGSTDNLMDYSNDVHLTQHQWYLVHEDLPAFSLFDSEEDGEWSFDQDIPFYKDEREFIVLTADQKQKGFLLLNGKAYKFNSTQNVSEVMFDKYGRVYSFKTTDGKTYRAFVARTMSGGDPLNLGYLSANDYAEFKSTFPGATSVWPAQFDFIAARRYQFIDCAEDELVFQRTVPYFHNGAPGPEFWIEIYDNCLVEREFLNKEFVSADTYNTSTTTGIYIGPSIKDVNYTLIEGTCSFDASIAELNEKGTGAPLYFCLKDETENDAELVALANYISSFTVGKRYAFYDDEANKAEYIGITNGGTNISAGAVTCEALKREEIFTVASFKTHYPKMQWFFARDADSVISHENIREGIPSYYNAYSIDYDSYETPHVKNWNPLDPEPLFEVLDYIEELYNFQVAENPSIAAEESYIKMLQFIANARADPYAFLAYKLELRMKIVTCFDMLGVYDRYEYSLNDLVNREKATFGNVIYQKEQAGEAVPINMADEYSQYVNKYDTESAFFIGFEYLKMYAEMLFEPAAIAIAVSRFQDLAQAYKSFKIQKGSVDDLLRKGGTKAIGKAGLLERLDNFPNLKNLLVARLDDIADAALINKIDDLINSNSEKLAKLDDLYNPSKFQMTAGANRFPVNAAPPFQASINGKIVNYNSQGFPDLRPHGGGIEFEFKSNSLTGSGSATSGDFKAANDWAVSNPALSGRFQKIPGSQKCLVKFGEEWKECTWHHHQDGRTMFPVPSETHNAFRHTGGKAIIERGLQDIFD